jgi:hypothetical protein
MHSVSSCARAASQSACEDDTQVQTWAASSKNRNRHRVKVLATLTARGWGEKLSSSVSMLSPNVIQRIIIIIWCIYNFIIYVYLIMYYMLSVGV